jgi:hypothetical protein
VLGSVVRNLLLRPLNKFFLGSLIYPALILFVLVLAGQSAGLVASPG